MLTSDFNWSILAPVAADQLSSGEDMATERLEQLLLRCGTEIYRNINGIQNEIVMMNRFPRWTRWAIPCFVVIIVSLLGSVRKNFLSRNSWGEFARAGWNVVHHPMNEVIAERGVAVCHNEGQPLALWWRSAPRKLRRKALTITSDRFVERSVYYAAAHQPNRERSRWFIPGAVASSNHDEQYRCRLEQTVATTGDAALRDFA
jgi:hypothetical protein